jgi:hypothetical protein
LHPVEEEEEVSDQHFEDAQKDNDSSEEEDLSGEDEITSFLPTTKATKKPTKYSAPPPSVLKKNKKKRYSKSTNEEEDQEPNRHPLSDSFHANRQLQRTNLHPNMAKTRSNKTQRKDEREARKERAEEAKKRAAASQSGSESECEDNGTKENPNDENQKLKEQIVRMRKRMKLINHKPSKSASKKGTTKALLNEIRKEVKDGLWANCKFIKNQVFLDKATRVVMAELELADLEGLEGEELIEAEEVWVAVNQDTVRRAMNSTRNYVHQQVKQLVDKIVQEGSPKDLPNVEEIRMLAERKGMKEGDPNQKRMKALFAWYVDELFARVAGNERWPTSCRHTQVLSEAKNNKGQACVTASDEAYVVALWENWWIRWNYEWKCKADKVEADVKAKEMATPYTNSKGGQKQFGGWLDPGKKSYKSWKEKVEKARETSASKKLEKEALKTLRNKHDMEAKEAKREENKKKKKKKTVVVEEDDVDVDLEDLDQWD